MNPVWIISKKRDGEALSDAEIGDFISRYAQGDIPDYQAAALAMAIGMDWKQWRRDELLAWRVIGTG